MISVHSPSRSSIDALRPDSATAARAAPTRDPDVKASPAMLSGAELMREMGGAPKPNVTLFGRVLHQNSVHYGGALAHLETYQALAKQVEGQAHGSLSDKQLRDMKDQLAAVLVRCDAYVTQHEGDPDKAGRVGTMRNLASMATAELEALNRLGQLRNAGGKGLTHEDAMAIVRAGVRDAADFNPGLNDAAVDPARSRDGFASGKVNSVSLLVYGDDTRIVKPLACGSKNLTLGEGFSGFDKSDMKYGARNFATERMAERLGIGDTIPRSNLVIHHGQAGLAMRLAGGQSLVRHDRVVETDPGSIARYDNDLARGHLDNLKRCKAEKNDDGQWTVPKTRFVALPYTDPEGSHPALTASLQKGLLDLQTLDCLMAQMDRQPENLFIRLDGDTAHVTGIDNDMCMGKDMTRLGAPGDLAATAGGPPPLMSREMHDRIANLSEDDFATTLGPDFSDAEVAAAKTRLTLLKAHAETLRTSGCVVDDFATWRSSEGQSASEFLMASDTLSYVKRDQTTIDKATKNGNVVQPDRSKHNLASE